MSTNSKKVYDECLGFDLDNRQGEVIHETTLKGSKCDGVDLRDSSAIFQNGGLKVRKLEEKDQYLLA